MGEIIEGSFGRRSGRSDEGVQTFALHPSERDATEAAIRREAIALALLDPGEAAACIRVLHTSTTANWADPGPPCR